MSETKLDKTIFDEELKINGYKILRSDRNRNGGGVTCYIRTNLFFSKRKNFSTEIEHLLFDIFLPKTKPILVGIFYRPPDQSGFLGNLSTAILNTHNFDNQEVYFLGDFNINMLPKNKHNGNGIKVYKELCILHNLTQIITEPTRITKNTQTLLDHILTNSVDKISQSGTIDLGMSDHQMIYCTRKTKKIKTNTKKYIKIRSLKNYTKEVLIEKISKIKFPHYFAFADINTAYADFMGKFMKVIDEIAPYKEICIKNLTEEWVDEEVFEGIRMRDKLYRTFKKTRLYSDQDKFKKARNRLQSLIKRKKTNYITNKLSENIAKPKELWKSLRNLGLASKKCENAKISLNKDRKVCLDPKENAEIFRHFYETLATDLVNKLPNHKTFNKEKTNEYYRTHDLQENNFKFTNTTVEVVLKLLEEINPNKAIGIDNLSGRFINDGASMLAKPITGLCNLSIKLSKFPDQCKIAKLKPLYKKGSNLEPHNYRPISLLPIISKNFEKIIPQQTQSYLDANKILYKYQSGFRANYSTDTCLSMLNDKILSATEKGMLTGMILIDLQKAFDTVDHGVFLKKLECLGFSDNCINWFKSYLENRTFIVNVEKKFSNTGQLHCGVPQGSILGPLIFLMYVNDMVQSVDCDLLLYADDSCLIFSGENVKQVEDNLNRNFNSLCDWLEENKLSIHFGEDKTKSILFGSGRRLKGIQPLDVRRGDIKIKQHTDVEYLGCILDCFLSGQSMGNKVIDKITSRLKFLYRKQSFLSLGLRRLLCNALIQPHFDYACTAWYPNLNKKYKKRIQIIQNKCIRFCLGKENTYHISHFDFREINWLPTEQRFRQCACVSAFKFCKGISPAYMNDIYEKDNYTHGTRRGSMRMKLPFKINNYGQKGLSYLAPKYWNDLSTDIKKSQDVNSFKHKVKENFFIELKNKDDDIYIYY